MRIVRTVSEIRSVCSALGPFGFVPTMGALHEGHLSLMRTAKSECGRCIASIFVNPTQFGPQEDFARYPRTEDRDLALAEAAEVDCIFAPDAHEMYPRNTTVIHVEEVGDLWEGAKRLGHFDGVATIVCKLFNVVSPAKAYFGLKDLQQCAVIQRMADDLNFPIELRFLPTVREPDGLALSSRNILLNSDDRRVAPALFAAISKCANQIATGELSIDAATNSAQRALSENSFQVDYLAAVNPTTMQQVKVTSSNTRIIVAAKLHDVRLIDNVAIFPNAVDNS